MSEFIQYLLVLLIGFITGFLGSTVGGGGLVSIPFLIFMGLPPSVAIATDRLAVVGQTLGAIPKFLKYKKIRWSYVPIFILLALPATFIGSNLLISIDDAILNTIIGIIILCFIPLILLNKNLGTIHCKRSNIKNRIGYFLYFCVMIFAAFFGGGAGTILAYLLMYFFGFTIIESMATDLVPWLVLSIISLVIFQLKGLIYYQFGIIILLGTLVGGYIGAHVSIKAGDVWIKRFFVGIIILSSLKLLFF